MQPLISIVTVTKDCSSTIRRTLESVKAIKDADIEYIIVDGLSTDGTLDIINRYRDQVDQLVSESDTGIYNAMNKGAGMATGEYILFLNGDDHLLASGFNEARKILARDKPEILSCQSEAISEGGETEGRLRARMLHLRFFNTIPHLSTFVSAPLQKKYRFREQYRIAADYDLFLRLYLAGHRFAMSDLVTAVHYRGGFSGNVERSVLELKQIRKANLGSLVYAGTRAIEFLNRVRKKI